MTQRFLVCDDHAIVREAIADMLVDRFPGCTVTTAEDFKQACELAVSFAPDLVLCDLVMPGAEPFDGVAAVQGAAPGRPLLVLTGSEDDALMLRLFSAGVAGFVSKNSGGQIISAAIQLALAGGRYLPPRLLELLGGNIGKEQILATPNIRLTDQQRRVLALVIEGKQNKVIAQFLGIAPSTVKSHLDHAMRQLEVSNRFEAANRAQQLGLI